MGIFHIIEPRWHDRVVLLSDKRIDEHNEVHIKHHEFPKAFYLSGKIARSYPLEEMPTKAGGILKVRAVPIMELQRETI